MKGGPKGRVILQIFILNFSFISSKIRKYIFLFLTKKIAHQIVRRNREDQSVTKHLSAKGRPDPRGELHCFWCPNRF